MSDRDDETPARNPQTPPWAAAGGLDSARAAALVEALGRSWPAAHLDVYPTPLLAAAAAVTDEAGQALSLLEALARGAMGPEVQAGALTLWPDFILRTLEGVAHMERR